MSVDLSGLTLGLLQGAVLLVLVYVAANPTRIVNAVAFRRAWTFLILSVVADIVGVVLLVYGSGWIDERLLVLVAAGLPLLSLALGILMLRSAIVAPIGLAARHSNAETTHA